ncbi:MAG: replicative DNA helicase [bacterium]
MAGEPGDRQRLEGRGPSAPPAAARRAGARTLPNATDAEASVLGAILLRNELFHQVAGYVSEADLYSPRHQLIFAAMSEVDKAGKPLDPITLEEQLQRTDGLQKAGGMDYLLELTDILPTAENVMHYVHIVRDKAMVRRLIQVTTEIAAEGYGDYGAAEDFLGQAEQAIFQITQRSRARSYEHVRPILQDTFKLLEIRGKGGDLTGVATGFTEFDRMTNGLQAGSLVIVAARPSMGKTSLALNMASHAAISHGIPVIVFSLEMTKEQLVERLLCSEARVEADRLRKGNLSGEDWKQLTAAASRLDPAKIYIDDSPSASLQQVRSKCRQWRSDRQIFSERDPTAIESPKGLVVIDYLQLMQATTSSGRAMESREREVSEISRGLKAMAKELDLPVLALSQLNRQVEKREDKRPNLSDLRESGAIEQDADLIGFIYRPDFYEKDEDKRTGTAELIIGKQRNGPTGTAELAFVGKYTLFENLSRRQDPYQD